MYHFLREWLRARAERALPQHLRDARRGEDLAYDHLRRLGYTFVARNYRPRHGRQELDLVAWDAERLAIIEVKTRASEEFGRPERAVGQEKRRHLVRAAKEYARRADIDFRRVRFDVVSVLLGGEPRIELYKSAFTAASTKKARRRF